MPSVLTQLLFQPVFFFCGRRTPRSRFCGHCMGDLQVCNAFSRLLLLAVRYFHLKLKMPRSDVLQDGWFTVRLAHACALRGIRAVLLMAVSQARTRARLPVLAGATRPRAWLLPCPGLVPPLRTPKLDGPSEAAWRRRSLRPRRSLGLSA